MEQQVSNGNVSTTLQKLINLQLIIKKELALKEFCKNKKYIKTYKNKLMIVKKTFWTI